MMRSLKKLYRVVRGIRTLAMLVAMGALYANSARAGFDFVESRYSGSALLGDIHRLSISRSMVESEGSASGDVLSTRWNLRVQHTTSDWRIRLGNPGYEIVNPLGKTGVISGESNLIESSVGAQLNAYVWHDALAGSLQFRNSVSQSRTIAASYRFAPVRQFILKGGVARHSLLPERNTVFYDYLDPDRNPSRIGGEVEWRAPGLTHRIGLVLAPVNFAAFSYSTSQTDFEPEIPRQGDSPNQTYLVTLTGMQSHHDYGLHLSMGNRWTLQLDRFHLELESRMQGFDGGRRFVYFGIVDARVHRNRLSIARGEFQWSLSYGDATGELAGTVDAWPFLNGILGSLGVQHLQFEAAVEWRTARVVNTFFSKRTGFSLPASLSYVHVGIDAKYRAWQAGFLGFGAVNIRSDQLPFQSADLLRLQLYPEYRINSITLQAHVSQWIPLSIRERPNAAPPPDSTASPQSDNTGSGGGWRGLSFGLSIRTLF